MRGFFLLKKKQKEHDFVFDALGGEGGALL